MSNCGQDFQKELTTAPFQSEVKSLLLGVSGVGGEEGGRGGENCESLVEREETGQEARKERGKWRS